ncbi:MAG: hypothetical protein IT379_03620 [Deltaproteobacteria bacterium]|nr:hypothetical protein [Deltaproteobacteria bacterium]
MTHTPLAAGTACADADACNGAETCDGAGACAAGTPPVVDDGNPCTADVCEASAGVTHTPLAAGTGCADADACDGAETCDGAGACAAGTPPTLDDGDRCTTDTCDPGTGPAHTLIDGCDPSSPVAGGPLETRASLLGRVVRADGSPVTSYAVRVLDAAEGSMPAERSDVVLTVAGDGSFRARLTTFPEELAERTPPARVLVAIESEAFPRLVRVAYLRPGDLRDLGPMTVLERDPAVTVIGPAGGVASDSQGNIELTVPPGALSEDTPIRITPIPERRQFPVPLPESTVTMYGMVLEPDGTEFAVPATLRVANTRGAPIELRIPMGYADEQTGNWLHIGEAVWDGTRFSGTIEHFSTIDWNHALFVEYLLVGDGHDANASGAEDCVGSAASFTSGSLRQRLRVPGHRSDGRELGVTLSYDSGLAGSRALGTAPPSSTGGVLPDVGPDTSMSGLSMETKCLPAAAAAPAGGCATGGSCAPSYVMTEVDILGRRQREEAKIAAINARTESGYYFSLPSNADGSTPAPGHAPVNTRYSSAGGGECVGGGAEFSARASDQQTVTMPPASNVDVERGSFEGYQLVYHRRASPYGAGWGLTEIPELFAPPTRDQVDLVSGDGQVERFQFGVRPETYAEGNFYLGAKARDWTTGEVLIARRPGSFVEIHRVVAGAGTTHVLTTTLTTEPSTLAVTWYGGERWFAAGLAEGGFVEIDPMGVARAHIARSNTAPTVSYVAAHGSALYYTSGLPDDEYIHRVLLDDPLRVVQHLGDLNGDSSLDPQAPLGEMRLRAPRGLAASPSGELYFACAGRHTVYRAAPGTSGTVDGTSAVVRVAGGAWTPVFTRYGAWANASKFGLHEPAQLSLAPDGALYVSSAANAYTPIIALVDTVARHPLCQRA